MGANYIFIGSTHILLATIVNDENRAACIKHHVIPFGIDDIIWFLAKAAANKYGTDLDDTYWDKPRF